MRTNIALSLVVLSIACGIAYTGYRIGKLECQATTDRMELFGAELSEAQKKVREVSWVCRQSLIKCGP